MRLVCSLQLARLGMFQAHEMIDHPLAAVYAVAYHGSDTKQSAIDLLSAHLKPKDDNSSFSQAMASKTVFPLWHREFPRHFLIVIDVHRSKPTEEDVAKCIAAVSKAAAAAVGGEFMVKVSAVEVNGGTGEQTEAGAQVKWSAHRHSNLACPGRHRVVACAGEPFQHVSMDQASTKWRGSWLTEQNLADVTEVINVMLRAHSTLHTLSNALALGARLHADGNLHYLRPHLHFHLVNTCCANAVPAECMQTCSNLLHITKSAGETLCHHMERRMSALRAAVAQHRGTLLRSLTKAIGFPSRNNALSQNGRRYGPDDGLYSFESPESRLRQLADMYFMIGQFKDAEGCYADVAEEFRGRRATVHYAAALEALALSRYMQMATGGATGLEIVRCVHFCDAVHTVAKLEGSRLVALRFFLDNHTVAVNAMLATPLSHTKILSMWPTAFMRQRLAGHLTRRSERSAPSGPMARRHSSKAARCSPCAAALPLAAPWPLWAI